LLQTHLDAFCEALRRRAQKDDQAQVGER
jgi:hypothetical protein